jgi:Flp pilus assembly protein TadD
MAAAAIAIFVTTALAVRTVYRNAEYGAPLALWRTVVERRPHGRARMAYATELVTAGRHDEALSQLKQAVSDFPDARYAFGTELVAAGHLEEGVAELQQFIRAAPGRSDRIPARLLLGHALTAQGKLNEGADQFRALLEDNPANERARQGLSDVAQAHVEAARAALDHRASEDAVSHARLALDLDPGIAEAHNLLGVVLASKGQLNDAIVEFRRALENKPDDQQARNNLAHALELSRGGVR